MTKEIITLTSTFERPHTIRHYLQSRKIPINMQTESHIGYLIHDFLARIPINRKDLYNFLDKIKII